MVQRTVIYQPRSEALSVSHTPKLSFALTFLALAFGLLAGMALAGAGIPTVVHNIAPAVVHTSQ
jgi:hypothetical protein